ncbi:MAG: putative LPS assembly protein LptD [Flavobacteriales bacterium]
MRRLLRTSEIILLCVLIMAASRLGAQTDSTGVNTPVDSTLQEVSEASNAEAAPDSIPPTSNPDVLDAPVFYDADSIFFDLLEEKWYLVRNAEVKYETMILKADSIVFDTRNNEACAFGIRDSLGVLQGKPVFRDGAQEFSQETVCFNFKTKSGYSRSVVTREGEAYVHTEISRRHANEWVHMRHGKFTTCDADDPHFHFHISKGIIVPGKKIVTGPVYMELNGVTIPVPLPLSVDSNKVLERSRGILGIKESKIPGPQYLQLERIPTPLALPFAFFPNKIEKSHGIIIPGYGDGGDLGFFLKEFGYYIPIGQYLDTKFTGDIYSRGSWSVRNVTNYRKRYRYNGGFTVSRTVTKQSFPELLDYVKRTDFFVRWNHTQDSKARPNTRFTSDLNFGTGTNFTNNLNSSQEQFLSSTFRSSMRWNKSFPGTPFSLAVTGGHTQNTLNQTVTVNVPTVNLNMSRIYPMQKWLGLSASGSKWYNKLGISKLGVSGSVNFDNQLNADESDVRLNNLASLLRQMRNGVNGNLTATTSIKTGGGFVTINPSFTYNNYLAFRYLSVGFDPDAMVQTRDTLAGLRYADDWRVSANATTQLFGTFRVGDGKVKAIRHVLTPTVGFSYTPYNTYEQFGFFGEGGEYTSYNPFEVARYSPNNTREAGSVNFSLSNNLEMKVQDDSGDKPTTKKVKLIDRFVVSTSYNLLADSLNLSNVTLSGNTTVLQRLNLSYSSSWSAYDRDENGATIDTFLAESQGKLLRMRSSNVGFNVQFSSRDKGSRGPDRPVSEADQDIIAQNRDAFVDFNTPWSLALGYNLNLTKVFDPTQQADTNRYTSAITARGDFRVLDRWKVTFNTGYDIVGKDFTTTNLALYWDLHCWELAFNYIPFGVRQSYSLQLNVKSALLQDLKLQRRGNLGESTLLY